MGKKVFISYKFSDSNVAKIDNIFYPTARDYVNKLQDMLEETPHVFKAEEDDNDLSRFKDETIESKLRAKIFDSTVTIVLVSPSFKTVGISESEQWIPWEISYSLKEHTRNERTSGSNALLAVVLPDRSGSYGYYITDDSCSTCHCRSLNTPFLFEIMRKNMFNIKKPVFTDCNNHLNGSQPYQGDSCYMPSVKWVDFALNTNSINQYLDLAVRINEKIEEYEITKETV